MPESLRALRGSVSQIRTQARRRLAVAREWPFGRTKGWGGAAHERRTLVAQPGRRPGRRLIHDTPTLTSKWGAAFAGPSLPSVRACVILILQMSGTARWEIRPLVAAEVERVGAVLGLNRLEQGDGFYFVAWEGNEPLRHAYLSLADPPELQDVSVRTAPQR
jgi:hypothetical protein